MTPPLQPHRAGRRDGSETDRQWIGDLHDAAARWRVADLARIRAGAELGNVVQFARPRRDSVARAAPEIVIAAATRPLTRLARERRARWLFLLAASLALHVTLYLPFQRDPAPMASIGLETISVEIVLGANSDAGLLNDKGTSEASAPTPAQAPQAIQNPEPLREPPTETATLATPPDVTPQRPVEVSEQPPAEARVQTPIEAKPQETPAAETKAETPAAVKSAAPVEPRQEAVEAATIQAIPEATAQAELHASINPATVSASEATPQPEPRPPAVQPPQTAKPVAPPKPKAKQPAERRPPREEPRQAARQAELNRSTSTAPAASAAGGIGRGNSAANSNYRGLVAAHLARHKRFPAEARGAQGVATVSFALSGSGAVSSVRLARASGVSALDSEALAMVRRASPFPPPPEGRGMSFTVPLSFKQN